MTLAGCQQQQQQQQQRAHSLCTPCSGPESLPQCWILGGSLAASLHALCHDRLSERLDHVHLPYNMKPGDVLPHNMLQLSRTWRLQDMVPTQLSAPPTSRQLVAKVMAKSSGKYNVPLKEDACGVRAWKEGCMVVCVSAV